MRLVNFSYHEHVGTDQEWSIDDMSLEKINLVVGRNASGKTRTINVIWNLAARLSGLITQPLGNGAFVMSFESDGDRIEYKLRMIDQKVISEEYFINGSPKLVRQQGGSGHIWAEAEQKNLAFQSPDDQIAVVVRQDKIQHSYLEKLLDWSKGCYYIPFGTPLGQSNFVVFQEGADAVNVKDSQQVTAIFRKALKEQGQPFKDKIIKDMARIGYDLEDVDVTYSTLMQVTPVVGRLSCLYVKEKGIPAKIEQLSISQGMFRALSTIIQINFGLSTPGSHLVLIDDIGEGLDYGRSCDLIQLIIERVKGSSLQLIASTNDRFIMNNVHLKYWTILDRRANKVFPLNYRNSRDVFDEFRFTGLSNFDFLSRDFFRNGQNEKNGHLD